MVKIVQRKFFKAVVYSRKINGEKKQFTEVFFDDKYAYLRAEELKKGIYDAEYEITPEMPVLDFIDIYMKCVSFKSNSKRTYETYVSIIRNYFVSYFGTKTLKEINKSFVLNLDKKINNQILIGQNHINKEKKHMSYELKGNIKSLLNKMFAYATEKGAYFINPMQDLKGNYTTSRFETEWDYKTLQILFEKSSGQRLHILLHCLFGTDLFIKEILAMTWSQVHIDDDSLARNMCYVEVDRYLGRKRLNDIEKMKDKVIKVFPPVLYKSNHTRLMIYKSDKLKKVYIPVNVAKILRSWKQYQDRTKSFAYDIYEDNDLVLALPNGKACEERNFSKDFEVLKSLYHLPNVKLAKLKAFSKKKVMNDETVLTIREYFYLSYNESISYDIDNIRKKIIQTKKLTNAGDYQFVDLKNIEIPTRSSVDVLKAIAIIKNDPNYANELASILKQ